MPISNALLIVFLGILLVAVVAVLPVAFIYSLNILFGLEIVLGLKTWGAALFLLLVLTARVSK